MKRLLMLFLMALAACALSVAQSPLPQERDDALPAPPQLPTDPSTPPLTTRVNPKDGLTYVWIPPGKFLMGCSPGDTECGTDETPHEVTIAHGFWIGQTPVTQAAFQRVHGDNPSFHHGDTSLLPAERVEWLGADAYCKAVGMRLPSEAEYEYAARAGDPAVRYGDLEAIAWYKGNGNGHTQPVATKAPNAWHLYDMLGDVWEYTSDPYKPGDPVFVALRGGSIATPERSMRVSFRGFDAAFVHSKIAGFRCVSD
jgi:formylglycine-generating enzyme required for sulfatase activity